MLWVLQVLLQIQVIPIVYWSRGNGIIGQLFFYLSLSILEYSFMFRFIEYKTNFMLPFDWRPIFICLFHINQ